MRVPAEKQHSCTCMDFAPVHDACLRITQKPIFSCQSRIYIHTCAYIHCRMLVCASRKSPWVVAKLVKMQVLHHTVHLGLVFTRNASVMDSTLEMLTHFARLKGAPMGPRKLEVRAACFKVLYVARMCVRIYIYIYINICLYYQYIHPHLHKFWHECEYASYMPYIHTYIHPHQCRY
jgi:hypothetical protein